MLASLPEAGLSLLAGSLTTLSPCVFPLLPLVLGGSLQAHKLAPVAMGAGMATSFAAIGLLLGMAGAALGIDSDTIRVAAAILLIMLAVVMLIPAGSGYFSRWLGPLANFANHASSRFSGESLGSAWVLGMLLGLVWSPCSGPLLASILTMVATEGGALRGGLLLGIFGAGAAIPLVAVAYASRAGFQRSRNWIMAHTAKMKITFAGLLGLMGVAILTGADKWLEARINYLLPDSWLALTTLF